MSSKIDPLGMRIKDGARPDLTYGMVSIPDVISHTVRSFVPIVLDC
jgi:hypothetical protein